MLGIALVAAALAGQVDHWSTDDAGQRRYHVVWEGADGRRTDTAFSLPIGAIERDALRTEGLSRDEIAAAKAASARDWAKTLPAGWSLTLTVEGGVIRYRYRAPTAADREALVAGVKAAFARGAEAVFAARGYHRDEDGMYRPAVALLDADKGDCDGKTALYLALLRARLPDAPLAAVRVPGHVFGAVGVAGLRGATIGVDGQQLVVVEPVGPGLRPPGTLTPAAKAATERHVTPVP